LLIAALTTFVFIKLSSPATVLAESEIAQANSEAHAHDAPRARLDNNATTTQAPTFDQAACALAEAERLRAKWEEEALRQSVQKYEQAASLWLNVSRAKAAVALRSAGDVYFILSDYKQALQYYGRALAIIKETGNRVEELQTLNSIGYAYIYLSENQKALSYARRVREDCRRLSASINDAARDGLEAQAINNIGEIYYALGDLKGSLKMFKQALDLWTAVNDRRGLALAHLNLGYSYNDIGNLPEASEHYHQSLALWQEIGDRRGEALASTALGGIYSFLGDKQLALNSHMEALALFRLIGNHQGEAAAINGVAQAYEDLNEYQKALENYQLALDLYQMIGNRDFVALNKYYIGRVYFALKDAAQARIFYLQAFDLSRKVRDKQIEAHVLKGLGIIDDSEGNTAGALKQFRKVLSLYDRVGDHKGKAYTLNSIGHLYYTTGAQQQALDYFRQALPLIRSTEDIRGEALTLYNIASVERDCGNLDEALSYIKESIAIIEASRVKVDSKDLRTSYFAQAHKHYELYIDLLMQLYQQQPTSGYSNEAFLASERARARSLLDILTEEKFDFGARSNDSLLTREQELVQLLNAKREYRTRLLGDNKMSAEANQVAEEIRTLLREYEEVQARIREQKPRYAAITQPTQLSIQEIQAELRAGDTLLLEFSLGDKRSYLWAVGPDSVTGYELPGRAAIESVADRVYGLLVARQLIPDGGDSQRREFIAASDSNYLREAAALSQILIGPVAAQLGTKRLLIVTDGSLHYIPFEALPVPKQPGEQLSQAPLLIDDHEIVELPSASILVAIRREKPRSPTAKTVAVLADPVFDKDDPRVLQAQTPANSPPLAQGVEDIYLQRTLRTLNGDGASSTIPRLPASLREAKAIMAVTPQSQGTMAIGFEASRARIMGDDLKNYRIIHFATHGILDNEHPEMSGLILSMIDKEGNSQDGYLRLRDIYGLDVRADLVVLSACRTGLGRSVQGEGLIGLTRGFTYAGSKTVVASLWKVDDEATAELMKNFYAYMLRDGLPPAAALRAAQQSIRARERWRSPYFWAGFILQGEYNETFAPPKGGSRFPLTATLLLTSLTAIALLLLWIRRKKIRWLHN
jgi:CHAT domain-containing protein